MGNANDWLLDAVGDSGGIFSLPNGAHCEALGRGYRMTSISELRDGTGIVAHCNLIEGSEIYGPDIKELRLTARYEGEGRLHVHITDANEPRWEVPESLIPRQNMNVLETTTSRTSNLDDGPLHEVSFDSSHPLLLKYSVDPFGFSVTRKSNNEVLFNTIPEEVESADGSKQFAFNSLVFKDQYLEISSNLPENISLYGLGEATRPDGLRLTSGKRYTLWATDIASYFVDIPLYSSYPIIMDIRKGGIAHGVLLLSSDGMDIDYEKKFITYKVIGGVFDFYFFAGPSPLAVVDQLTELVGRPAAMPYWSLGLHQARFGYKNVEELEYVTERYAAAKLPMESMSADIDHMDNYKDFTLDPVNYPEEKLRPYVDRLHENNQKFIMILDPNIAIDENYKTYTRASALDVFLKNGTGEGRYIAQVWPGPSNIPDFLHPNAQQWWSQEIADFHSLIPFDGLWLDMNEPANFCSEPNCYFEPGAKCPELLYECCMTCNNDEALLTKWDNPPYKINSFGVKRPLYYKTVALSAEHYNGARMYDTHNIYGMSEALITYNALRELTKKRPFILSRSCFVGSGSHVAHWTGDNGSIWSQLRASIVSILSSGMSGMPMVGSDICGFNMDTTEELCGRWVQVGAFYPFARSHSDYSAKKQEFYLWDSVAKTASHVLYWRYRLLPFLYTLMYEAHTTGAPLLRPLFFAFPQDEETLTIDHQFMLGHSVLVSPVLDEATTSVNTYFPEGLWYDLFDSSKIIQAVNKGVWEDLYTPVDATNVYVRQGSIIPMQEFALTTTVARRTPFTLLVVFEYSPETLQAASLASPSPILCDDPDREYAYGHLFIDDSEQINMKVTPGRASYIKFEARRIGGLYTLRSSVYESDYALSEELMLQTIKVLGVQSPPQSVYVNGRSASVEVKMHPTAPQMELVGLQYPLGKELDLVWSTTSTVPGQLLSC